MCMVYTEYDNSGILGILPQLYNFPSMHILTLPVYTGTNYVKLYIAMSIVHCMVMCYLVCECTSCQFV